MEVLHDLPTAESFIPLSTHQAQTPDSFFSGPPVLHHHSPRAKLSLQANDLRLAPTLQKLFPDASPHTNGTTTSPTNGSTTPPEAEDIEIAAEDIDVWVTSERFILSSPLRSTAISIPYPCITLHAIQQHPLPALFLQLLTLSPAFDDHDPDATVSLTLTPCAVTDARARDGDGDGDPVQGLYDALSACANLHPDPALPGEEDDEDDGGGDDDEGRVDGEESGLPPPVPGSGGWITAENVGEFFDEEGGWRGDGVWRGGALGEGAGSVRRRREDEDRVDGEEAAVDGEEGVDGEETKWRRTG